MLIAYTVHRYKVHDNNDTVMGVEMEIHWTKIFHSIEIKLGLIQIILF